MWCTPYYKFNIGITALTDQMTATQFINLPYEIKVHILKAAFDGKTPLEIAGSIATIEGVSREWRKIALAFLWPLATKMVFHEFSITSEIVKLKPDQEPNWKEIYRLLYERLIKKPIQKTRICIESHPSPFPHEGRSSENFSLPTGNYQVIVPPKVSVQIHLFNSSGPDEVVGRFGNGSSFYNSDSTSRLYIGNPSGAVNKFDVCFHNTEAPIVPYLPFPILV